MYNFTREIKDIDKLKNQLQNNKFLKMVNADMLQTGNALLAFRNNEATIYYEGRRFCNLKHKSKDENDNVRFYCPTICNLYLPVLRSIVGPKVKNKNTENVDEEAYINKTNGACSFSSVLPEILDNMEKERDAEAYQASRFYQFSPLSSTASHNILLLDIEASFSSEKRGENKKDIDRIDLVFYHTEKKRLMFVEVKRLNDERWRRKKQQDEEEQQDKKDNAAVDTEEVIKQMKKYRAWIEDPDNNIKEQYNNVISYYNYIANKKIPSIGDEKPLLGLLLVEFSRDKYDSDRKKCIYEAFKKEGFGVSSIGDTDSISKNDSDKANKSLEKIYSNIENI